MIGSDILDGTRRKDVDFLSRLTTGYSNIFCESLGHGISWKSRSNGPGEGSGMSGRYLRAGKRLATLTDGVSGLASSHSHSGGAVHRLRPDAGVIGKDATDDAVVERECPGMTSGAGSCGASALESGAGGAARTKELNVCTDRSIAVVCPDHDIHCMIRSMIYFSNHLAISRSGTRKMVAVEIKRIDIMSITKQRNINPVSHVVADSNSRLVLLLGQSRQPRVVSFIKMSCVLLST